MKPFIALVAGMLMVWGCGSAPPEVGDVESSSAVALAGADSNSPYDIDGDGALNREERRLRNRYGHDEMVACREALFGQLDNDGNGELCEQEQTRAREQIRAWLGGECPFDGACGCDPDAEQPQLRHRLRHQEQVRNEAHLGDGEFCTDCLQNRAEVQTREEVQQQEEQNSYGEGEPCDDCEPTQEQTQEQAQEQTQDQTQSGDCACCGDGACTGEPGQAGPCNCECACPCEDSDCDCMCDCDGDGEQVMEQQQSGEPSGPAGP